MRGIIGFIGCRRMTPHSKITNIKVFLFLFIWSSGPSFNSDCFLFLRGWNSWTALFWNEFNIIKSEVIKSVRYKVLTRTGVSNCTGRRDRIFYYFILDSSHGLIGPFVGPVSAHWPQVDNHWISTDFLRFSLSHTLGGTNWPAEAAVDHTLLQCE